jgi:hypothetical protein
LLSHNQHRLRQHFGYIDPKRVELARASIGAASWRSAFSGIFGDATTALHYMPLYSATIISFPERRSELARLRAEIEELKRCVGVA